MANLKKFERDPQRQLLEELKSARCIMLGSPDHSQHMQPMAPQVDEDARVIYFYTDKTTDLAQTVMKSPGIVHMCHIDSDYQACVRGELLPHNDNATIEKFWGPMVDAWFPRGKDDPNLMMLKFVPHDAALWASDKSALGVIFEVAKANIKDEQPDLGKSKHVQL